MKRSTFLKALGLLGAAAVVPIDILGAVTSGPVYKLPDVPPVKDISTKHFLKLRDLVQFTDGSKAVITRMEDNKVRLTPVFANQDLGNGYGMHRTYDKDDLPEIVTFHRMYSESSF